MRNRIASRLFGVPCDDFTIGRFEIEERVGAGGMGVVYRCRDPKLGRLVAIKLLHPEREDPRGKARLELEAYSLAQLAHPNVVQVFEVGEASDRVFIAMEWIEGQTLLEWISEGHHTWRDVVGIFVQAARGLAAAHDRRIVHRDFKPSNVLVGNDGRVRVVDFGLAFALGSEPASALSSDASPESPKSPKSSSATTVAGTVGYMSPEQLRGEKIDDRSDQWSFCVTLWQALYGERPRQPSGYTQTAPDRRAPRPPERVRAILARGLEPDRHDRWPDMQSLADALDDAASGSRARQIGLALGAGAFLASAVFLTLPSSPPCADAGRPIAGIWTEETHRQVQTALGHSPSGAALAARLTAHQDNWTESHAKACRATRVDGAWSAARSKAAEDCLERSARRFRNVVDTAKTQPRRLADRLGDTDGMSDSLGLALGDPAACTEPKETIDTNTPALAALARAELKIAIGDARAARQLLADRTTEASGPLAAILLGRLRARLDIEAGWTDRAMDTLSDAASAAARSGLPGQEALARLELADASLMHLHDPERGTELAKQARDAVARVADPPKLMLEVERLNGIAAFMLDHFEAAQDHFDRALALAQEVGADSRVERIQVDMGNRALRQGDPERAKTHFQTALDSRIERVGPAHPSLAPIRIAQGRAALMTADNATAALAFQESIDAISSVHGSDSPRLTSALAGLATAHINSGALVEAEATAHYAVKVQARLPESHPDRGGGHAALAWVATLRGDHEEAAEESLLAAEARSGLPDPHHRYEALTTAAWHLNYLGRWEEAREHYAWVKSETADDNPMHLIAAAGYARAIDLGGDHVAAVGLLDAALSRALEETPPDPWLVAEIQWHLASALDAKDDAPGRTHDLARRRSRLLPHPSPGRDCDRGSRTHPRARPPPDHRTEERPMSCDCNQIMTLEYDIVYKGNDCFEIRIAGSTQVVTSCGGELHVSLTGSYDCARLVFNYRPGQGDPEVSEMTTTGSCPCQITSGQSGNEHTYTGLFQPPNPGSCRYVWTLYTPQPPCRITIVVSKS